MHSLIALSLIDGIFSPAQAPVKDPDRMWRCRWNRIPGGWLLVSHQSWERAELQPSVSNISSRWVSLVLKTSNYCRKCAQIAKLEFPSCLEKSCDTLMWVWLSESFLWIGPSFSAFLEMNSIARVHRIPAEEGPAQMGLFGKAGLLPEWHRTSLSVHLLLQQPLKCHRQDQPGSALYYFCGKRGFWLEGLSVGHPAQGQVLSQWWCLWTGLAVLLRSFLLWPSQFPVLRQVPLGTVASSDPRESIRFVASAQFLGSCLNGVCFMHPFAL